MQSDQNKGEFSQIFRLFSTPWAKLILVLGVLVHLAAFALFRVTNDPQLPSVAVDSHFQFANASELRANPIIEEQVLLYDPEPLFLPTRWNASPQFIDSNLSLVSDSPFTRFEPELLLKKEDLKKRQWKTKSADRISKPSDTLLIQNDELFSSFGQTAVPLNALPQRAAVLTVYDFERSERILSVALDTLPGIEGELEQIGEFLVVIDTMGLVGTPLVERNTGNGDLDNALRAFISEFPAIKRLKQGYYRITMGP